MKSLKRKRFLDIVAISLILMLGLALRPLGAGAQTNWQERWDQVVAVGKKEGVVVVTGPPFAQTRLELEQAFGKRFGFRLEYVGSEGAEAVTRVEREAVAGRLSIDAMLGGNTELLNLYPAGRLAPVKDKLMLPEVLDPKKWRDGKLKFNDPEGHSFLQTLEFIPADAGIPQYFLPKEGIQYSDKYTYEYTVEFLPKARKILGEVLGR